MFYGGGTLRNRYPVDERIIFERLWRGALCQALGAKAPIRAAPRRQQCCCHCHCGGGGGGFPAPNNNTENVLQRMPPRRTMRSVVR